MAGLIVCVLCPLVPLGGVVVRDEIALESHEALAAQAPFGGLLAVQVGEGAGARNGSGVLLNGAWALTAAHVLWGHDPGAVRLTRGGEFRVVDAIFYPDQWLANPVIGLGQGSDLALMRLASPWEQEDAILAEGGLLGSTVVTLGFGRSGSGTIGAFLTGGGALAAMNTVDRRIPAPGGGFLVTDFDSGRSIHNSLDPSTVDRSYYDDGFSDPLLSEAVLEAGEGSRASFEGLPVAGDLFAGLPDQFLEGTSAAGDSGGPVFVPGADGQWRLAGLTSWGVNPLLPEGFARGDSRYGDLAFATDLSLQREWIASVIPEPGTACLVLLALPVFWRRR